MSTLSQLHREYTKEQKIRELTSPAIAKKVDARVKIENQKLEQIDDYSLESLMENVA